MGEYKGDFPRSSMRSRGLGRRHRLAKAVARLGLLPPHSDACDERPGHTAAGCGVPGGHRLRGEHTGVRRRPDGETCRVHGTCAAALRSCCGSAGCRASNCPSAGWDLDLGCSTSCQGLRAGRCREDVDGRSAATNAFAGRAARCPRVGARGNHICGGCPRASGCRRRAEGCPGKSDSEYRDGTVLAPGRGCPYRAGHSAREPPTGTASVPAGSTTASADARAGDEGAGARDQASRTGHEARGARDQACDGRARPGHGAGAQDRRTSGPLVARAS
jgi:hypothetical protein